MSTNELPSESSKSTQHQIPSTSLGDTALVDHDYASRSTLTLQRNEMVDHDYAKPSTSNPQRNEIDDHDYTKPSVPFRSNDHSYTRNTTDTALNHSVQDHIIQPDERDQYDMLTFLQIPDQR